MDSALPFKPQGVGQWLAVTNAAPANSIAPTGPTSGDVCYLVYNPASQADAFIGYGPTSAAAISNAQVPLPLSSTFGAQVQGGGSFIAPTGTLQVVTVGPGIFFAGKSLGSCSVWIQPGYGV